MTYGEISNNDPLNSRLWVENSHVCKQTPISKAIIESHLWLDEKVIKSKDNSHSQEQNTS